MFVKGLYISVLVAPTISLQKRNGMQIGASAYDLNVLS